MNTPVELIALHAIRRNRVAVCAINRGTYDLKKILIATAAAVVTLAPAHAQEASNFGGAKIGALVGYDKVRVEYEGDHGSKDGLLYGLTAGYDFDLGTAIIGIEGEVSDATTKARESDVFDLGDTVSLRAARDLYIGARVGFPVTSTILLYAKAGYTNARFKLKYNDGVDTSSEGDNLDGYRIGGGAEFAASHGTFARIEYRYSDYGSYDVDDIDTGLKTLRHQVAVTGGWRF